MRLSRISLFSVLLFTSLFSTFSFAAQPDRISGAIDAGQMVAVPNHVSPLAQSRFDEGMIEPSHPLRVTMLFTPTTAQQAARQKLMAEQQDPRSPNYHKWLTPEQIADRFGMSPNDIGKIAAWLQSQGFKVMYTARGGNFLSFSGNAGQVQSAFKTSIHYFNVNGQKHFSNATAPMIPAALSGIVGGFRGMHDFVPKPMSRLHNPNAAYQHGDYTLSGGFTFLAPGDIATIYDINPLYQASTPIDGTGQKIVVVGQSDVYLADLNDFRGDFGLSTISGCTTSSGVVTSPCNTSYLQFVVPTNAADPGLNSGDLGESDLDLEWTGSVARKAQIIFVTSDYGSGGVFNSTSWAIDNDLAPVMSISYGLCEAYSTPPSLATQDVEFQNGALEGISIFAASGDSGAAICDASVIGSVSEATLGLSVSYPASSPSVTAVGGTEFNEGNGTYWGSTNGTDGGSVLPNGPLNGYIPELAWNDTLPSVTDGFGLDGTGGGPSNCENTSGSVTENGFPFSICDATNAGFAKPAYQTALTPQDSARDVPDISFSASNFNDPYIVCAPQSETNGSSSTSTCVHSISEALNTYNSAFGGTSASTPVAAGMAALLNQYLGANGLGNLNTGIYQLFSSNPSAFHDITSGTNTTTGNTSDNIVPCLGQSPSFEPAALKCPSALNAQGSFGYSAGAGYDLVTGLGSVDFQKLFVAWAANVTEYTLASSPTSVTVTAGNSSSPITVTVTPATGYVGTIAFTCSGLPSGATCAFSPASLNLSSGTTTTLTIQTTSGATAVSGQTVTITGTAGALTATTTVALTVTANNQSFTLTPSPASTSIVAGNNSSAITVTITPVNGFAGTVTFACSGLPTGATCSNFTSTSATTSTFTISTAASMAPSSNVSVTITGTSSTLTAMTSVALTVTATNQSFTLAPTATTLSVKQGASIPTSISVTGANGFNTALTFTCSGMPTPGSCTVTPSTATTLTTVTLNVSTTAPSGALRPPFGRGSRIFYAALLPGLFGIVFAAGSKKRSARAMRLLGLIAVLGCSTLWLGACSNSSSTKVGGTPPGTYPLTVTATTGGANPVTGTTTVSLTVTQ